MVIISVILVILNTTQIHTGIPSYFSHLLTPYCPSRVLRSSYSSKFLQVPRTNLTFGSRSFRAAAQLFGTLFLTHSVHQKHSFLSGGTSKHTFTKQLLIPPTAAYSSASDSFIWLMALNKSFYSLTYLLTYTQLLTSYTQWVQPAG